MTREELKRHCEKQVEECERWAKNREEEPHGNIYEEHKLILELLEQQPCEDIMTIHTQGLGEGIRCAMCTNSMKSDRGCDGGCMIDKDMYEKVMDVIRNHIVSSVTPTRKKGKWIEERDDYGNITGWHCSNCYDKTGFVTTCTWDYCPSCGAEMESEE